MPLIRAIQDGIQKCVGGMIKDPELIELKFMATWTERPDIIDTVICDFRYSYLLNVIL